MLTTLPSQNVKIFLGWTGYESVFTRTSPRTAQDCVKPVLCGPVCGPSIFGNIGPVRSMVRAQTSPGPGPDRTLKHYLEQHQAPTGIAAFSYNSICETFASAVYAYAVFVWCSVVKDVGRMCRILKLLPPLWSSQKVRLFHLVFKNIFHYVPN